MGFCFTDLFTDMWFHPFSTADMENKSSIGYGDLDQEKLS
jgi:hypothetical protein